MKDQQNNIIEEQDSDQLFEHFKVKADKGQDPLRIDKFLMLRVEKTSRNRIQNAAKAGCILVNGKVVKSNYKVRPGDEIKLMLPHEPRTLELIPEKMELDIVYEDDSLIIVNKPSGLVVHPGYGNYTGTLVNGLIHHFDQLPQNKDFAGRPGLVHRIDKLTTGLMVVAKTEYAMTHLAKQFFDRTVKRRYQAIVWGDVEPEGRIEGHIGRHLKNRQKMTVFEDASYGKHAVTHFKLIRRFGYVSHVECRLETGRTHQIRVHMAHIGHALFGDPVYGGNRILKGTVYTKYKQFVENCFKLMPRQALHAKSLGFIHPKTEEEMYFESDLPEDMETVIAKWETYASHRLGE